MDAPENSPFAYYATASVAGCTNDGLVYAVSIDPILFDVNLWVHSGVQDRWHMLCTSELASASEETVGLQLIAAAMTQDKKGVDTFLEAGESAACLFRFFIASPTENCVYTCADAEISFYSFARPTLHWLGEDFLLVAGRPRSDTDFHVWRLQMEQETMTFTLTDLLARDVNDLYPPGAVVCTDEDHLYLYRPQLGEVVIYVKSPDDTLQHCHEVVFPISVVTQSYTINMESSYGYPCTYGKRLWLPTDQVCYMLDCKELMEQSTVVTRRKPMFTFEDQGAAAIELKMECAMSSAHFFWMKENGMVGQKCIGMPSLQYMCLRKLCETSVALKRCTDEKEAKKMGISYPVWNRFFRPLV